MITFTWTDGGTHDLRLGAEEVAAVDENLIVCNEKDDLDGDRLNEITIFHPSTGTFYSILSPDGSLKIRPWGISEDRPYLWDFDGEGKADYVVFRRSCGTGCRLLGFDKHGKL